MEQTMVSNKEDRSNKPKSEGEKHQGVGVNPAKHKENQKAHSSEERRPDEPIRKSTGKQ
jgi:hypothetical protein